MTPGVGFSLTTPFGPIQANVGYNQNRRAAGAIYFEDPTVAALDGDSPLYCVSPGNAIDLTYSGGILVPPANAQCPESYGCQR